MTDDEVILNAALARIEERLAKIEELLIAESAVIKQIALSLGIRP